MPPINGPNNGKGRPPGARNKKSIKRADIALKILNGRVTPLEIMWQMARGVRKFNQNRFEAAKACAPYVHPKLIAMKIDANVALTHEQALEQMDQLEELNPGLMDHLSPMRRLAGMEDAIVLDEDDPELVDSDED